MKDTVTPTKTIDQYIKSREHELAEASVQNIRYRLKQFRQWTDEINLKDISELDGMMCEQWKLARVEGGLEPITVQQHMRTFRHYVRWMGTVGYVDPDLHELIRIPSVDKSERSRDVMIEFERAEAILEHLGQFAWASRRHIIFGILWHTAMRTGSLRALDVDDVEEHGDIVYVRVRHRPKTGTPLKLRENGSRNVTISDTDLADAILDYINHTRTNVEDGYGRDPLITTKNGRASETTIRVDCYRATHPCEIEDCPHDRNKQNCEYRSHGQTGGCPSARSPHAVRRGAITAHLNRGIEKEVIGERAAVSVGTLESHYDARTEEDKRRNRLLALEELAKD